MSDHNLTAEQKEAVNAAHIIAECLENCAGDVDSGYAAAEILLAMSVEERERLCAENRRRYEEERRMRRTLRVLDRALARTAPQREAIALALAEQQDKPVTLYGITGPLPVFPAVSETSELFGEPEE